MYYSRLNKPLVWTARHCSRLSSMERCVRSCSWAGLQGALAVLLFAALFSPEKAFSQSQYAGYSRVWSTSRGIVGRRVPGPRSPALEETNESYRRMQAEPALEPSLPKIAGNPQARASLRYDWDPSQPRAEGAEGNIDLSQSPQARGVRVELFIDPKTDAAVRRMSREMGIPYNQALSYFMRVGRRVYTERLFCAKPLPPVAPY